jgi:hypothetical protein
VTNNPLRPRLMDSTALAEILDHLTMPDDPPARRLPYNCHDCGAECVAVFCDRCLDLS